jgi:hypothetical protein
MDIIEKQLGKYGKAEIDLEGGELVAKVSIPVIALVKEAAVHVKAKIPGSIDDLIIDALLAEIEELLKK